MSLQEGCRIVRGPAWEYGDQDGGEGGVGTVVDIGSGCFQGWVVVVWDYGYRARYRIGNGNKFDLLLLDNSFAGVEHRGIQCHGNCLRDVIDGLDSTAIFRGMRWQCTVCGDIDLCTSCYMSGEHDVDHTFVRFDVEDVTPFQLPVRRDVPTTQGRGLFPGAAVTYRPAWKNDKEGEHLGSGEIVALKSGVNDPAIEVKWNGGSQETKTYRLGEKGRVDIKCTEPADGWPYFKAHLPIFGYKIKESSFRPGDRVTVIIAKEKLKELQKGPGLDWSSALGESVGQIGFVNRVVGSKVTVGYPDGRVHTLHESALEKVLRVNVGDKVRIKADKGLLKRLLPGHGGWNDDVVRDLGKSCRVIKIDRDGDIRVKMDSRGKQWSLHPGCVEIVKRHTGPPPKEKSNKEVSSLEALAGLGGLGEAGGLLSKLLKLVGSGDSDSDTGLDLGTLLAAAASSSSSSSSTSSDSPAARIHQLAFLGNVDGVKEIIKQKPDAIDQVHQNQTPIQTAIGSNEFPMVEALVEAGADLTKRNTRNHGTVLHHATDGNHHKILKYLLPRCPELIDVKCDNGLTALHVAAFKGHKECGQMLVEHNCNPNITDANGNTPLFAAIDRKMDDIDYLLDAPNLDVGFTTKRAFTMLHQAVYHNATGAARKIVKRHEWMVSKTVPGRQTPLHIAAKNNYTEMIAILLSDGNADFNATNANGETALHMLCEDGNTESVELLLGYSADVNKPSKTGETPLHLAAKRFKGNKNVNETPTLKELRKEHERHGVTSVQGAFLVLLVKNGGKLDVEDKKLKTPLSFIENEKIKSLLQKLEKGESLDSLEAGQQEDTEDTTGVFITHVDGQQEANAAKDFEGVHRINADEVQIGAFLGKGAFGVVKKGTWRGTPVAVKIISMSQSQKRDVEREVAVHKNTRHPNIVRMMAIADRKDETLLVMQLADGSNLQDAIFGETSPPKMALSKTDKIQISVKILQAIRFLHESAILHLDIKPSNIIIERGTKKPYLCDLGVAHMKPRGDLEESAIGVRGTLFYMPPEGLQKGRGKDSGMTAASDVWSIGATLLEMFTEKQLWGDGEYLLILARLVGSYSPPPILKAADADVRRIIEPSLAKEPDRRPTAAALMQQFEKLT